MKVAIFGPRTITEENKNNLINTLLTMVEEKENQGDGVLFNATSFLIGGAQGVQAVAEEFLSKLYYDVIVFKPWTMISAKLERMVMEGGKYDPVFFFYRNIQIVDNADLILVFDNGEKDAEVYKVKELCEKKNKRLVEYSI